MLGSSLARAAAFAALLTLLLVGFEQCTSRDLRVDAVAELDAPLERTARAVAEELGAGAIGTIPAGALIALADRAGRLAGVRITLIDETGSLRADSEGAAANLAGIENPAHRAGVGGGRARRLPPTGGRALRYVAVPAPGGGVVRVSDDLAAAEPQVALAR